MNIVNISYSIGIVIHVVFYWIPHTHTWSLKHCSGSNVKRFYFYRTVFVFGKKGTNWTLSFSYPVRMLVSKIANKFFCCVLQTMYIRKIFGKWKGMLCWKTYAYMCGQSIPFYTLRHSTQSKSRWCCIHWYKRSTCIWRMCTQFLWPFEIFIGQVEIYIYAMGINNKIF